MPSKKKAKKASEPKTQEELDEEELRETEAKMREVLDLMTKHKNRDEVDAKLEGARISSQEHTGNRQPIYHVSSSHHVPTTMHTKTRLDLAELLKLRIALGQYARNLDDTLERLSEKYVDVLERILSRSRY